MADKQKMHGMKHPLGDRRPTHPSGESHMKHPLEGKASNRAPAPGSAQPAPPPAPAFTPPQLSEDGVQPALSSTTDSEGA